MGAAIDEQYDMWPLVTGNYDKIIDIKLIPCTSEWVHIVTTSMEFKARVYAEVCINSQPKL